VGCWGDDPGDAAAAADTGIAVAWGDYEPAVRHWGLTLGRPAPAPTQTGRRGGQQLSPRFVEWLMGLPAGWVTAVPDLSRNDQLKLLGNGVVPAQAAAALEWLLAIPTEAAS
jgi:DNA (cytosine-5)-methyltransferase 1